MATHQEIEDVERPLIDAWNDMRHKRPVNVKAANDAAVAALALVEQEYKTSISGFRCLKRENRNHWETLKVNAAVLGRVTTDETLKANCLKITRSI